MSTRRLRFDGAVALVTGGGHGMGRAHCVGLAERGAAVAVVDIDDAAATSVATEIADAGGVALALGAGIDRPSRSSAIDEVVRRLGRLDIVVNNAGIAHDGPFADESDDDLERLLDVHLRLPFHLVQAAWPQLEANRGRVVNVVSNAALFGKAGMTGYAASKGALLAWTRALALEAAPSGIGVNAVAPVAATRLTDGLLGDLHERLDPALVTPAVLWLAHRDCAARGLVLSVAGGAVARVVEARCAVAVAASAEEVRDGLAVGYDLADASVPASAADEMSFVRRELTLRPAAGDEVG